MNDAAHKPDEPEAPEQQKPATPVPNDYPEQYPDDKDMPLPND